MDLSYDPPETFRHAADRLHELVAEEVGADDFGPTDYLSGLKVYLQALDFDPRFHEQGRRAAWGQVIQVLKGRAHAIKSMKENPGFAANALVSPVVDHRCPTYWNNRATQAHGGRRTFSRSTVMAD